MNSPTTTDTVVIEIFSRHLLLLNSIAAQIVKLIAFVVYTSVPYHCLFLSPHRSPCRRPKNTDRVNAYALLVLDQGLFGEGTKISFRCPFWHYQKSFSLEKYLECLNICPTFADGK